MDINNFLAIMIVGALLSAMVQYIQAWLVIDSPQTKVVTIILSIILASIYVWVQSTPWFNTLVLILGTASTIYAFFLKTEKK